MNRVLCCARRSARLYRAGAYGSCAAYGIRNERQKNPAREAVPSQYRVFKGLFLRSFVSFVRKKTPFSRNMPEVSAAGANQGLCEGFTAQMPQACRSGTAILRLAQRAWGTGMTLPERTSLRKVVSFRPLRLYAALLLRCGRTLLSTAIQEEARRSVLPLCGRHVLPPAPSLASDLVPDRAA